MHQPSEQPSQSPSFSTTTFDTTISDTTLMLGDVALAQREAGSPGTLPEGANVRRPTMNRVSNDLYESGVFLMEPESAEAKKWLKQLREMPDVRLKKIMRIRAEISKGTYETAAKWRIALDRLLQEMGE
jgi:hypothetical protein